MSSTMPKRRKQICSRRCFVASINWRPPRSRRSVMSISAPSRRCSTSYESQASCCSAARRVPARAGLSGLLAAALQQAGYEVRQGTSVDEAERFLTDAADGERLFLLDDPFGSRERREKASAAFSDLRRLIEHLPRNRRLIVAQVDHVLFEICRKSDLAHCPVGTVGWNPVRPIAVETAHAIWAQEAKTMGLEAAVVTRIDDLIECDFRLRSPGALTLPRCRLGRSSTEPRRRRNRRVRSWRCH